MPADCGPPRPDGALSLVAESAVETYGGSARSDLAAAPGGVSPELGAQPLHIVILAASGDDRDRLVRELKTRFDVVLVDGPAVGARDVEVEVGGLRVDRAGHRVTVSGEEILLTNLEFKLLVTLVDRKERVQSRAVLLTEVWGVHADSKTRTVDTHIKRLRGKLRAAGKFIQGVRGVGYRFSERPAAQRARGRAGRRRAVDEAGVVAA